MLVSSSSTAPARGPCTAMQEGGPSLRYHPKGFILVPGHQEGGGGGGAPLAVYSRSNASPGAFVVCLESPCKGCRDCSGCGHHRRQPPPHDIRRICSCVGPSPPAAPNLGAGGAIPWPTAHARAPGGVLGWTACATARMQCVGQSPGFTARPRGQPTLWQTGPIHPLQPSVRHALAGPTPTASIPPAIGTPTVLQPPAQRLHPPPRPPRGGATTTGLDATHPPTIFQNGGQLGGGVQPGVGGVLPGVRGGGLAGGHGGVQPGVREGGG